MAGRDNDSQMLSNVKLVKLNYTIYALVIDENIFER